MPWQRDGTPDTLTSAGDVLEITDLSGSRFMFSLVHILFDSNSVVPRFTFNSVGGMNYVDRNSLNGTTDATNTNQADSQTLIQTLDTAGEAGFIINYGVNIQTEEKLNICFTVDNDAGTGSGVAPNRREKVWKFINTADLITTIECNNIGSGDYATDTNISVLSTN